MSLDKLREELTRADRRLLELVAERQRIVAKIGKEKRRTGYPTRDFRREKDVLDAARATAEKLGVPGNLAESVLRLLIESSLTRQEQARVVASGYGSGKRALVIGGAGQMGRWFASFLDSLGFGVEIARSAAGGVVHAGRHVGHRNRLVDLAEPLRRVPELRRAAAVDLARASVV